MCEVTKCIYIYQECGDRITKVTNREGCDDPGKSGHETKTNWLGSTRKPGKCGEGNCSKP